MTSRGDLLEIRASARDRWARVSCAVRALALVHAVSVVGAPAAAQDGAALYTEHCASCHDRGVDRAPDLASLRAMTPQRILQALEFGSMVSMTDGRTAAERRAMAEYASGKSFSISFTIAPPPQAMCRSRAAFSMEPAAPVWNGFGQNGSNTLGGVQWGSAGDGERVYVALSDLGRVMLAHTQFPDADRTRGGGMFALRLADGARVWHTPPRAVRRAAALQPGAVGCRQRDSRRGVLGVAGRPHPRVRNRYRPRRMGFRHGA